MDNFEITDDERKLIELYRNLAGEHRNRLRYAAESIADNQEIERGGGATFCNGCICWRYDSWHGYRTEVLQWDD